MIEVGVNQSVCEATEKIRDEKEYASLTQDGGGRLCVEEFPTNTSANNEYYYGPYHELYLQRNGVEFMSPIMFQDGMDYEECEFYYASLKSQHSQGGAVRPVLLDPATTSTTTSRQRRTPVRENNFTKEESSLSLRSCLRKSKFSTNNQSNKNEQSRIPSRKSLVRSCSFSGMPTTSLQQQQPSADSSNSSSSSSSVEFHGKEPKVSFEPSVKVTTVHSLYDLPREVRIALWMTRDDMAVSIRRAALENLQEQRQRLKDEQLAALLGGFGCMQHIQEHQPTTSGLQRQKGCVERTPNVVAVDSVITECLASVAA